MRETIDQGLQELQAKQGKDGLPTAPASATAAPVEATFAREAPPADSNAAAEINQQLKEADQAEQEVSSQAQQDAAAAPEAFGEQAPPEPISIELGQSIGEVTSLLGQPVSIIDLKTKKIYRYKDMKITFVADKVTDVQ